MELEKIIPKNTYKKPKEVREKVVCDIAMFLLKCAEEERPFRIMSHNRGVYLSDGNIYYERRYEKDVRVHGVEMDAAFKALHQAGYYLYASYCITDDVTTYVWSQKPWYGKQEYMNEPCFSVFID